MLTEEIVKAYCKIRTIDSTIPDEILDFMRDCAIEKLTAQPVKCEWVDCNERVPYSGCYHVTIEDGDKNVSGAFIERFLGMWAIPDDMNDQDDLRVTKWLEEK
jgi:hypothetical protein